MTFRKEIKYQLSQINFEIIKANLLENGMLPIYPLRKVNSCYFDTENFQIFDESLNGILPRYKYRIRSYDKKNTFYKEIKISSVEGRFKTSEKISEDEFENIYQNGIFFKSYGLIKPKILISYNREYYIYKNCRLTFDFDISYSRKSMINQQRIFDSSNVMELKTSIEQDNSFIEDFFSFQSTSFSKYVRGIYKTYNFV